MSIKIHDAFRYKFKNVEEIGTFHKTIIELCQYDFYCKYIEFVAETCINVIFRSIEKKNYSNALSDYISDYMYTTNQNLDDSDFIDPRDMAFDGYMDGVSMRECVMTVIKNITSEIHRITSHTSPMHIEPLVKSNIFLYYIKDSVLLCSRPNSNMLIKNIHSLRGVHDYHYQNSSDRPVHIPQDEWDERRETWDLATSTYFSKISSENCSEIIVSNPNELVSLIPFNKNFTDDSKALSGIAQDTLKRIQETYEVEKSRYFKIYIERKILENMDMDAGRSITWYMQRVKTLRSDYSEKYRRSISEMERIIDETFSSIISVGKK